MCTPRESRRRLEFIRGKSRKARVLPESGLVMEEALTHFLGSSESQLEDSVPEAEGGRLRPHQLDLRATGFISLGVEEPWAAPGALRAQLTCASAVACVLWGPTPELRSQRRIFFVDSYLASCGPCGFRKYPRRFPPVRPGRADCRINSYGSSL